MFKNARILIIFVFVLIQSCSPFQITEDAFQRISKHKRIAIAPIKVVSIHDMLFVPGLNKGQKMASFQFHNEVHRFITENSDSTKYWFELIDSSQTLTILKNNAFYDEISYSPFEISNILDVDGLIVLSFFLDRRFSETGRDIERFGDYAPTQNSYAQVEILDRRSRRIIWSYYHRFSSGLERSDESFVEDLFINVIDKIPYFQAHKSTGK